MAVTAAIDRERVPAALAARHLTSRMASTHCHPPLPAPLPSLTPAPLSPLPGQPSASSMPSAPAALAAATAAFSAASPSSMRCFSRTCRRGRVGNRCQLLSFCSATTTGMQHVRTLLEAAVHPWAADPQTGSLTQHPPATPAPSKSGTASCRSLQGGGGAGCAFVPAAPRQHGCRRAGSSPIHSLHVRSPAPHPPPQAPAPTCGRLQQRVVPALQRRDHLAHEAELHAVGLVRELHLAAANGVVGGHGGGTWRRELLPSGGGREPAAWGCRRGLRGQLKATVLSWTAAGGRAGAQEVAVQRARQHSSEEVEGAPPLAVK